MINEIIEEFKKECIDEYDKIHALRYAYTYEMLLPFLKKGTNILEVGDATGFNKFIKDRHPNVNIDNTVGDLRYPLTIESNKYDLVLNMEVLEHIKDPDGSTLHCIDFSGANTFISECYRVLKPGGHMLLTTPNGHSLSNIGKILDLATPMCYIPHVHEYGARQTGELLENHGFKIVSLATKEVWWYLDEKRRITLTTHIFYEGLPMDMFGDDTFVIAKK